MKNTWSKEENQKEGMKYERKFFSEDTTNTTIGARSYRDEEKKRCLSVMTKTWHTPCLNEDATLQ